MEARGRKFVGASDASSVVIGVLVVTVVSIVLGVAAAQAFTRFQTGPSAQVSGILATVDKTLRSNLTDSDLVLMPVAGQLIRLQDAKVEIDRDGFVETLPLTVIAGSTKDGAMWRAGEEVCIVGTSPGCVRSAADTVRLTIVVGDQLMFRETHHLRAFKILPTGAILTSCSGPATVRVVGSDITYGAGGPQIPVRLNWTANNGTTLAPLFGLQPIVAGMEWTTHAPVNASLGLRGSARYGSFHAAYSSWTSDAHVAVLKDGDAAPNVPAFGNQTSVETFLRPYVDTQTRTMRLAYNEAILLFEFNAALHVPAADWQDAVALVRFNGGCVG